MQQLDLAKRYLQRMENIYEGVCVSDFYTRESCDDDVTSFFIHCYHIKDWIIQLSKLKTPPKHLDAYINSHKALMICADLANGSKHCKLTRSLRTAKQPHITGIQRQSTNIHSHEKKEKIRSKYTILNDTELYDALTLAKECISLWEAYMSDLQREYENLVN